MILPGATLGMLGGGQLGRMFTVAARTMGYRVLVLDPDPQSPAGALADEHLCAAYDDDAALAELAQRCAVATTEFENVSAAALDRLAEHIPVRPAGSAVAVCQDRITEKTFLRERGFSTAAFAVVWGAEDLALALTVRPGPGLLKVSRLGYDGKGQARITSLGEARTAFASMGSQPCVLEELLDLQTEISVVCARGADGSFAPYPLAENRHANGILDLSRAPARLPDTLAREAVEVARAIAEKLDYCGVLAVEFFVTTDGRLLVNELAPRPHNSGHYTLDACLTDQFQQQVRAVCGLPLGDTRLLSPAVMVNLLGDLWPEGGQPDWSQVLRHPNAHLHLYGKHEARPGRKMGHYTVVDASPERAMETAEAIRRALVG